MPRRLVVECDQCGTEAPQVADAGAPEPAPPGVAIGPAVASAPALAQHGLEGVPANWLRVGAVIRSRAGLEPPLVVDHDDMILCSYDCLEKLAKRLKGATANERAAVTRELKG